MALFRFHQGLAHSHLQIEQHPVQGRDLLLGQLGEQDAVLEFAVALGTADDLADVIEGAVLLQLDADADHLVLTVDVLRLHTAAPCADIDQLAVLRVAVMVVVLAVEEGRGGERQAEVLPCLVVDLRLHVLDLEHRPVGFLHHGVQEDGDEPLVIAAEPDLRVEGAGLEGQLPRQTAQRRGGLGQLQDPAREQIVPVLQRYVDAHSVRQIARGAAGWLPLGARLNVRLCGGLCRLFFLLEQR